MCGIFKGSNDKKGDQSISTDSGMYQKMRTSFQRQERMGKKFQYDGAQMRAVASKLRSPVAQAGG